MRYIRYAVLAIFAVALIVLALANRGMVRLQLLPDGLADLAGVNPSWQVPLFVVIFGGVIIGFVWEWIREAGERVAAARQKREMGRLKSELRRLKGERHQGKDEVLALLEEAS